MIIDARGVEEGSTFQTSVCVIGGGVAGITLVLELKKQGIDSYLLESGGFTQDKQTRDLYRGENAGLPYVFDDGHRSRYLGGSSNCWGGNSSPMEPLDFEKRDWVNYSGWPFDLNEMVPYYKRSHPFLKLGPYNYDPDYWENAISKRPDVRRVPLISGRIRETISQFSPPARFGILYGDELEQAKEITVLLHANVTNIETDEHTRSISSVKVVTLKGNTFYVFAKLFVLATGGIENARLLLASNNIQQAGLGNDNDLVGRFFIDHPRFVSGSIKYTKQWLYNRLYDIKLHYHDPAVSANGTCIGSQLALSPEVMRTEGLLNSRISFFSVYPGEGSKGALALWRLKEAVKYKDLALQKVGKDLISVIAHPLDTIGYGFTRIYKSNSLIRDVKFQMICEQAPNPDSRVMLSKEKDQLGMNRVKVDWRLGDIEKRTFKRTLELVSEELKLNGVAEKIVLDAAVQKGELPSELTGTWHHMGTTRMHDSPRQGVVDRNCRVHSTTNLYIAGSSVFPTAGGNFPTITLCALAIRLSDHIKSVLNKSS